MIISRTVMIAVAVYLSASVLHADPADETDKIKQQLQRLKAQIAELEQRLAEQEARREPPPAEQPVQRESSPEGIRVGGPSEPTSV